MRKSNDEGLSKAGRVILTLMEEKGLRTGELAAMMGKSSRVVCDRIAMPNISVDKLNEIVRVLGYKIMVVPFGTRGENYYDV